MRVLVLEPCALGHHGPYLDWMTRGLAQRGFDVDVVTLPETIEPSAGRARGMRACDHPRVSVHFVGGPKSRRLPLENRNGVVGLLTRELAYWRLFRAWYTAHAEAVRPDLVFLPYLDYCLYAMGLAGSPFGNCPWAGLAMRPAFHYREMGIRAPTPALAKVKKALFLRAARSPHLKCLLTIDEPLASYVATHQCALSKVVFFPEPAELGDLPAAHDAKQKFGFAPERKVILLYGALSARKGVAELLRALAAPDFPKELDVLLAGQVAEPETRAVLGAPWVQALRNQGRLKVVDRFIDVEEEPALFAAADVVWLGYRNHYNASGLLVQAANAGRPVLSCDEGVLGWQVERHHLGRTVNPENPAAVAAAASALLDTASSDAPIGAHATSWRPPSFAEAQDTLAHALGGD